MHSSFRYTVAIIFLILSIFILVKNSHSAGDGSLGATSYATSVVSIRVSENVQISGVADLDFGIQEWNSTLGDISGADDVCIYSNSGAYKVSVESDNGSSKFAMRRSSDNATLEYEVQWFNESGKAYDDSGYTQLEEGESVQTVDISGADKVNTACAGGSNAAFAVKVESLDNLDAVAGADDTFFDTLTITIAPA